MGILFNSRTWREPLRLINSWLPAQPHPVGTRVASQPVLRFTQAGWLGGSMRARSAACAPSADSAGSAHACRVRVVRTPEADNHPRSHGRVLISGRIGDVCAELDRLAALELGERRRR